MAYCLTFFCRSGAVNGSSALAAFLAKLTATGDRVLIAGRGRAGCADEVDGCELATDDGSGTAAAGWLILQFWAGVEDNARRVIHASPSGEDGIWGSDLVAELTLSGAVTDWPLVQRAWAALAALWPTIAWDEMSGFDANKDPFGPA